MFESSRVKTLLVSRVAPVRPTMSETTALGAAMAAGAAEGVNVWNLSSSHLPRVTCETYEPQINLKGEELPTSLFLTRAGRVNPDP